MVRALAWRGRYRQGAGQRRARRPLAAARRSVGAAEVVLARFGDIWLRDTGPIFSPNGVAHGFPLQRLGRQIRAGRRRRSGRAHRASAPGAVSACTTSSWKAARWRSTAKARCSPRASACSTPTATRLERRRRRSGAARCAWRRRKVLWLDDGLRNDHTDGHIDNLARFVAPAAWSRSRRAATIPMPSARRDRAALTAMTDAHGRPLEVIAIPSPGLVETRMTNRSRQAI